MQAQAKIISLKPKKLTERQQILADALEMKAHFEARDRAKADQLFRSLKRKTKKAY